MALVLAHTILVVPYVVLIMRVAIKSFDERIEQVAFTLGASKLRVLWSIVLPEIASGLWYAGLNNRLARAARGEKPSARPAISKVNQSL